MRTISTLSAACLLVTGALVVSPAALAASTVSPPAEVTIVQALPGARVSVAIDGRMVRKSVAVGSVLGPYDVSPGAHKVRFTDPSRGVAITSTLSVGSGSNSDVVVHRPAAVGGAPVVNYYRTPRGAIGPGKGRVLVAHTATVAPADVRVDGTTIFTNIANGEYATADVPAGPHRVELLPTGRTTHPILGPLDLDVVAGTVTMVYAVGNPQNHSMDVVLHSARLTSDGSVEPLTIDTGSAGLAASTVVRPFGGPEAAGSAGPTTHTHGSGPGMWWPALVGLGLAGLGLVALGLVGPGLVGPGLAGPGLAGPGLAGPGRRIRTRAAAGGRG